LTDQDRIAELLLQWEEAWESGQDVSVESLCQDRPDLIGVLEKRIKALKATAWVISQKSIDSDQINQVSSDHVPSLIQGRYRIDAFVGQGGYGQVYKAYDEKLGRVVAVKVPRSSHGDMSGELQEEARRLAQLRHPGIVGVHDVGVDDGLAFIIAEFIDGQDLRSILKDKRFSTNEAARIVIEVADALAYAHQSGFLHRDIKPANILLDRSRRPIITDFGIAVLVEDRREDMTMPGTLAYMAPEQIAGQWHLVDARTDIYSLGVVFFEMLTGHSPYSATSPVALREQILFKKPLLLDTDEKIPSELLAICMRCLSKHPGDRFESAKQLAESIREALSKIESVDSSVRRTAIIRRLAMLVILVVAAVGMTTLVARGVFHNQGKPSIPSDHLVFDGTTRLITPLERDFPITLEAWVYPEKYENRCHFVIGSDVPSHYGLGLGICGVLVSAEYVKGILTSQATVPICQWSHLAVVFSSSETRLYFNGTLVEIGPASDDVDGSHFVIGNVGENNPIDFFIGQIRQVRISRGEVYTEDFVPQEDLKDDPVEASVEVIAIYEPMSVESGIVSDKSGHGLDARVDRLGPTRMNH
jgi:serine/threonine protein kinase